MTKKEAAEFLGLSVKSLEKYMSQRRISFNHVKGKHGMEVEFTQEEVERFKEDLGKRESVTFPSVASGSELSIPVTSTISKDSIVINTNSMIEVLQEIAHGLKRQNKQLMNPNINIDTKLMLTLDEASLFSGAPIGIIKKEIKENRLKGIKLGRSWRVKREDLEIWVKGL